jgi:hypothetical protein
LYRYTAAEELGLLGLFEAVVGLCKLKSVVTHSLKPPGFINP